VRNTNWSLLGAVAAGAVYAAARVHAATVASPAITPDSFDYARQSHLPVLSGAFWGSQHPPLLPLLWKLDPWAASVSGPTRFHDVRPLVLLNVGVGVACWLVLAGVVASLCRRPALRAAAFLLVLLVSLSPDVAGWDAALLSESLALSLTALLAAAVVMHLREPSGRTAAAVAATMVASCATRDTTLLLCACLAGALVVLVRQHRGLLIGGVAVAAVVVLWGNHAADERWKIPARNSMANAIVFDHAGPWFARHDMPVSALTPQLLLDRPTSFFDSDPRAASLRAWFDRRGRATWYRYLAEHPGYAAWPLRELPSEVDGDPAPSASYLEHSSVLQYSPYRHGAAFWLTFAAAVLAALYVRTRVVLLLVGATGAAAFVTILAVHNLDPFDVQRHLIETQLSIRLVLYGLVLLGAEELAFAAGARRVARRRSRALLPAS
jgi:hypothetical protein